MSLRARLNAISKESNLQLHPRLIEELRSDEPHTIRVLEIVEVGEPAEDFNCVMFALDLIGCLEAPCSPLGRYYMGPEFMDYLISEGHVSPIDGPKTGALAVYLRNNEILHVGVVHDNGMIHSKWGAGHVYEHDIWEVPESLGDEVRFFSGIRPDSAFELFWAFHYR